MVASALWSTRTPRMGGLAVLYGNIAQNGAIIKSAGIDEELFHFKGRAFVVESQDEAVYEILSKT